jgi:hypothetical protein
MIVILAFLPDIAGVMSIMPARMIGITGVVPILVRIMRPIIRFTWLISGVLWLTKNELSLLIGMLTGPNRASDAPPIASR